MMYALEAASMPAPVSEKAFDEYHLYTLNRPATLHDRETKQVEFLRAERVSSQRLYVYDGARIDHRRYRGYSSENIRRNRDYGTDCNPKVWVMNELENSEKNNLGIPLPRGVVEHLYRWINWEIVEKSDDFIKTDSQTVEFRVLVPADEEKVITYKVHLYMVKSRG